MMVEYVLFTAISEGLDWFKADSRRFENLLTRLWGISETEASNLRAYFDQSPPNLIHGYPRAVGPFPAWAIVLEGDPIRQTYLGDDVDPDEYLDDEDDVEEGLDDGGDATRIAQRIDNQYGIYTYVQDIPDICRYYYHLLRHILLERKTALERAGLAAIEFSGQDLQPDARYLPENIWIRRLGLTGQSDIIAFEAKESVIRSVDGMHVSQDVESDDGVAHNVEPYAEE